MSNGDGTENGRKSNRPNQQKKKKRYLCPSNTLFCTFHFFAVVLHDYVLTCTFYSFYGGNSVCADLFLTCSRLFLSLLLFSFLFFFFTAAHYNLGRCLFSHRAARKLSCSILLPTKYIIPLRFLSLTLALSSVINVNVDIKTYLVEGKTRICCCCCFFPLKVRWSCDLPLKREGA